MTFRLALRSLLSRPVRSAVLACGFGFGIAVMADLLGVGEVVLEQARSPALMGGGDLVVSGPAGRVENARFVMMRLGRPPFADRIRALSPSSEATLYLIRDDGAVPVKARGGIPGLERTLGDPETSAIEAWTDAPSDRTWSSPDPGEVLREIDRFHPIPAGTPWEDSWAEWLYFNGRAGDATFYLSFIVGPAREAGHRDALALLQLSRNGRSRVFPERAAISGVRLLEEAPDIRIGRSQVKLDGLVYRIQLDLREDGDTTGAGLRGEIALESVPGRSLPPFTIRGARGWLSGYTVPVLSGSLAGSLRVGDEVVSFDGGTGYHDHNWGFWKSVTWQWGQVAGEGLSFVFGRVHPPHDAADPDRIPAFLAVFGDEGPLGFATRVAIEEAEHPELNRPARIRVLGKSESLDLDLDLAVEDEIRTGLRGSSPARGESDRQFLQLRGSYRVVGRVGSRDVDFSASGSAETFRER